MGNSELKISKAVIPAAGLGTRLLPVTKEIPKEMLPVAIKSGRNVLLKPMLQAVFEELHSVGVRDFCFITGRGKRSIEDHFTPDWSFLEKIKSSVWKTDLESFFRQLEQSRIYFVNQARRRGFGDAVLHSEEFAGTDRFIVHAGDDLVLSRGRSHLRELSDTFERTDADAALLVEYVNDPRKYGVIVGEPLTGRVMRVTRIVEKPEVPPSHLAVIAVYVFGDKIYDAIRSSRPDSSGEVQLTSAIESMIQDGRKVVALRLRRGDVRIDIGSAESYIRALVHASHIPHQ